jgi:bifunctional non-homologous end joining protein LigD
MPLTWKELESAHPLDYTMANAADALEKRGDIWNDILKAKQDLKRVLR